MVVVVVAATVVVVVVAGVERDMCMIKAAVVSVGLPWRYYYIIYQFDAVRCGIAGSVSKIRTHTYIVHPDVEFWT